MRFTKFNIVIFIGFLAIIGVIIMQILLLNQAYKFEKKETEDKIFYALQDVVEKIYRDNKTVLSNENLVKKITDDYYIVNVDDVFENKILEHYLKTEFAKVKLDLDFEYAIYDCGSDSMMYGNYVSSLGKSNTEKCATCFTKNEGLTYYFAVRFPKLKQSYLLSIQQYWMYTFVLIGVLIIYVYSVLVMLKQKKYTELQKDFINNMTHEFKTPLASILIASNFMKGQKIIEENSKLAKYVQIIIHQCNKLNQHIEKILYVAKTESNQIVLERTNIALKNILDLVLENSQLKYQKKISFHLICDQNYTIFADEFHFYNMVFNIVDNAIKYSGSEPEIELKLHQTTANLEIHCLDNGIGIPDKDVPFIFDKFYRVSREDSKEIEGFGIGLAYVKRICELHYWKVSIHRNRPQGTHVIVSIPKRDVLSFK